MAELIRGTAHVDGSEVVVDIESTVSFKVSLIGPEGFRKVSVGILAFPFEVFLLTGNGISGENECEPVVR